MATNNLPKIYAHCPAGCKWETVHRSEFEQAASHILVYPDVNGYYVLQMGKEYKIFADKMSATAFVCTLTVSGNEIWCYTNDEYANFITFKLLKSTATELVYELDGVRYKETVSNGGEEYALLVDATRVYMYNADASITIVGSGALSAEDKAEIIQAVINELDLANGDEESY